MKKKLEENLLEMTKLKEEKDKQLLKLEIIIGYTASITFLTLIFVASFIEMTNWIRIILIGIACVVFFVGLFYALYIEQVAGYYECKECHNKYIPTYKSVFFAPHVNRTRYMRCHKYNKKSCNK